MHGAFPCVSGASLGRRSSMVEMGHEVDNCISLPGGKVKVAERTMAGEKTRELHQAVLSELGMGVEQRNVERDMWRNRSAVKVLQKREVENRSCRINRITLSRLSNLQRLQLGKDALDISKG